MNHSPRTSRYPHGARQKFDEVGTTLQLTGFQVVDGYASSLLALTNHTASMVERSRLFIMTSTFAESENISVTSQKGMYLSLFIEGGVVWFSEWLVFMAHDSTPQIFRKPAVGLKIW